MSDIEKIQAAEAQVQQMQEALESLQNGLARAEEVAVAADEAKRRSAQALKAVLVLIGLSIVLLALSRRRPKG
jgi:hypothetical protein